MDLTKPFRELVDRRLWPVALLLVLALAAVPLLLTRSADSAGSTAPVSTASGADDVEPVVDAADPVARDADRKVIGREKDPFRAAGIVTPTPTPTAKPSDASTGSADSSGSAAAGSSGSGSASSGARPSATATPAPTAAPTAPPAPAPAPAPAPVYSLRSLEVRFGTVEDPDHADRILTRLSGLPKGTTPALLYLGLLEDEATAVFLVGDGVAVLGDGTCKPSRKHCETLRMRRGDVEFVGVAGGDSAGQYQVEMLKVHTRRTSSANVARTSRTRTARGGERWLRAMDGKAVGLRYDAAAGTLTEK